MRTPDVMPLLSRGAHRKPSKGACFMEFASYLAGESWSDSPACTHPVLAAMAREVNDRVGDEARQSLLPFVPEVVGLVSADPRTGAWIAREAAFAALRLGTHPRQGVAAIGVLHCERRLAELDTDPAPLLSAEAAEALRASPEACQWAFDFVAALGHPGACDFDRAAAPAIVASSVQTVVDTVGDEQATRLLADVIGMCRTWMAPAVVDDPAPERLDWAPARGRRERVPSSGDGINWHHTY